MMEFFISAPFLILTFYPLFSFADIVRDELWFNADFSVVTNGRNINDIIMHVNDVDFARCTLYCVQHMKCQSVNYNTNEQRCELCDGEYSEWEGMVDGGVSEWKNYGTPKMQNGGYSEWIDGQCSVTCGVGEKIRYRRCNDPTPRYGGNDCKGPYLQNMCCNTLPCPVAGGYSDWSEFGTCSKTCDVGIQSRMRACDNPRPSNGGADCSIIGNHTEYRNCSTNACPVTNMALRKPSKQSTIHPPYNGNTFEPDKANDGDYKTNSVTQGSQLLPWWSVDMEDIMNIDYISITLNGYAFQKYYYPNLIISTSVKESERWVLCKRFEPPPSVHLTVKCKEHARYVKVSRDGSNRSPLYLNEVEVFGNVVAPEPCPTTHPYVFYNGDHCCRTSKETVYAPQGELCDGSDISITSLCCAPNDGGIPCPHGKGLCINAPKEKCKEDDIAYHGNDIRRITGVTSWDSCSKHCDSEPTCTHWGWVSAKHSCLSCRYNCNLKTSDSGRRTNPGIIAGRRGCRNVDGGWGVWTSTTCSVTCGSGTLTKTRSCDTPSPSNGGVECLKSDGIKRDVVESITAACETQDCPGVILKYFETENSFVKNRIVTTIPKLNKAFLVSFEVFPTSYSGGWASILHMSVSGSVYRQYGHCTPCVLFHGTALTTNRLRIVSAVNGNGDYAYDSKKKFPLNKWIKVKVQQIEVNRDAIFSIYLDDEKVHEVVNEKPSDFDKVKVYVTNPWDLPQDGRIRNLTIDSQGATVTVDGGWGMWTNTTCSVTCGNGTLTKTRSCDTPSPSNGGLKCLKLDGIKRDVVENITAACETQNCPVCVYTPSYAFSGHNICGFQYIGTGWPSKNKGVVQFRGTTFPICAEKCITKRERDGNDWNSFYWYHSHLGLCKCMKGGSGMTQNTQAYFYRYTSGIAEWRETKIIETEKNLQTASADMNTECCPITVVGVTKEYQIKFEFKATSFKYKFNSIVVFKGFTGVYLKQSGAVHIVTSPDIRDSSNKRMRFATTKTYNIGDWVQIKISQSDDGSGSYKYSIVINDELVYSVGNPSPLVYDGISVYSPHYYTSSDENKLDGFVRSLLLYTKT